jgi:hypothetical protein
MFICIARNVAFFVISPTNFFCKLIELLKTSYIRYCAGKTGTKGILSHGPCTSGMHTRPILLKMVKVSKTTFLSITDIASSPKKFYLIYYT